MVLTLNVLILQAQDDKLILGNPAFKFKSADETDYCSVSCCFPGAGASLDNKMQKHEFIMEQSTNGNRLTVNIIIRIKV